MIAGKNHKKKGKDKKKSVYSVNNSGSKGMLEKS